MIGGITADGELLMQMYEHSINSLECVRALKPLVRHLGKVLVVWNGAPNHRSNVVKEYLSNEGKGLVHLEQLLAYVPEVKSGRESPALPEARGVSQRLLRHTREAPLRVALCDKTTSP